MKGPGPGRDLQLVYQLIENAMTDSKGKLREAEREVAFRRRVLELSRRVR